MSYNTDNSSMDNSDLLYTNKFIDNDVYDISKDKIKQNEYINKKKEFRKFMEGKRPNFNQLHHPRSMNIKYYAEGGLAGLDGPEIAILGEQGPEAVIPLAPNDPLNTNPIGPSVGGTALNTGTGQAAGNEERFVQEFHTYIHIDSRDRDPSIYPNPNHYRLLLKRNFTNIKEIKLKSTEFPNTQQLIRSTPLSQANNRIFWNIEADGDQLYVATLEPGSYAADTFARELSLSMSRILRNNSTLATLTERQQSFTVSIDTVTDLVNISSVTFNSYSQILSVTFGSNIVKLTSPDIATTLSAGDRIIIENSNDIGGIVDSDLDGEHIVSEIISENEFRFEADSIATSSVASGGGTTLRVGIGVRFKLLWSLNGTPASILGFQEEDTDFALFHENTKDSEQITLTAIDNAETAAEEEALRKTLLYIHEVEKDPDSTIFSIVTTTINHGLTSGDRIFILDYDHTYGLYDREIDLDEQGLSTTDTGTIHKFEALINAPAGHIVTVINSISFKVPAEYVEPPLDTILTIKNSISDDFRNARIIQRSLNKALKLSGENYIYMTSPLLESMLSTAPNENNVRDIFYVLQLNAPPGSVMFNSFIGNPKRFYEAPLPFLDEVEFRFITHDGEPFEFNDQDHSYTIEVVEALQKQEGSELSSRIGATT